MFLAPRFLKRDGGMEDGWSWSTAVSMVVGCVNSFRALGRKTRMGGRNWRGGMGMAKRSRGLYL